MCVLLVYSSALEGVGNGRSGMGLRCLPFEKDKSSEAILFLLFEEYILLDIILEKST